MKRNKQGRFKKKGKNLRSFFMRITKTEKELIDQHRKQSQ